MKPEMVVRPHVENFIRWAENKPEVVVLSADLTNSCEVGRWRDTYPDRFFSMGMAEQNMLSFAAGLAREGFKPYLHTFAVFLYRRPLDQLLMSIAYPNLPVRLIGFLPGITTPGGVTHQAVDDVAVLRSAPNMTIIDTGDATEVESSLDAIHDIDGPVYVRMLRGDMPRLFPVDEPMQIGVPRVLRQGTDVLLVSAGISTEEAIRASAVLEAQGVSVGHLHLSTLKPFGSPLIGEALARTTKGVITIENHTIIGGLGSAMAETMIDEGVHLPLRRLGLKDQYAHGASRAFLMETLGLDAKAILDQSAQLLGTTIETAGLDALPAFTPRRSLANAESL